MLADATVSACTRFDKRAEIGATVTATLDLEGDYSAGRKGEITLGLEAETNLPADPVAGGVSTGYRRKKEGANSGTLKISFRITAEVS